jgi:hypothetical protein
MLALQVLVVEVVAADMVQAENKVVQVVVADQVLLLQVPH